MSSSKIALGLYLSSINRRSAWKCWQFWKRLHTVSTWECRLMNLNRHSLNLKTDRLMMFRFIENVPFFLYPPTCGERQKRQKGNIPPSLPLFLSPSHTFMIHTVRRDRTEELDVYLPVGLFLQGLKPSLGQIWYQLLYKDKEWKSRQTCSKGERLYLYRHLHPQNLLHCCYHLSKSARGSNVKVRESGGINTQKTLSIFCQGSNSPSS